MVIIIGILAAIAIPTFLAQREKAQIAACRSDTRNAAEAAVLYAADNDPQNDYTGATIDLIKAQGFNQTDGYTTSVVGTPGANISLQTVCAGGVGTATFSTTGADAGQVTGPTVAAPAQ